MFPELEQKHNGKTCNTCYHRQMGITKVIQYCGVNFSNRTNNGLKKIKCKDLACQQYKKEA